MQLSLCMPFPLVSDPAYAATVDPGAGPIIPPGVPATTPAPYSISADAEELLLAIGRATSFMWTPLAMFVVASHWAILRWCAAFDWSSAAIALSPGADDIRAHHRVAFSEALGLGAGLIVAEAFAGAPALPPALAAAGPQIIDVDSIIPTGTRPDLVVHAGPPGPGTPSWVLECKGNSTGPATSLTQLRTGMAQTLALPAPGIALPGPTTRMVVGVAAPRSTAVVPAGFPGFEAYGVTVPAGVGGAAAAGGPAQAGGDGDGDGGIGDGGAPVPAGPGPLGLLGPAPESARLRRFAGDPELGGVPIGEPVRTSVLLDDGTEVEIVGRRATVRLPDLTIVVTIGVEERVYASAAAEDDAAVAETRRGVSVLRGEHRRPRESVSLREAGRSTELARDGCLLSLQVA